ncbi:hypothetical protein M569_07753 [Genlisea aurea]|uniref:RING-type E3 ubiquitin transferase n=1 Tax=Genlisea aurea TaxID=192259 RepID=S8E416_9LAMI|nr:hypothetical protein M569_07753 [Genlisea aurea]
MAGSLGGKRCPICLGGLETRSPSVILPCGHAYCVGCIRRWSDVKCNCPLCNYDFRSWWLCRSSVGYGEEEASPIGRSQKNGSRRRDELLRRRRYQSYERRRIVRRSREDSVGETRSRILPKQRSFRRRVDDTPAIVAERTRQWRSSIYRSRLRGVLPPQKHVAEEKESTLKRIGPWIRRELQALLDDPDPTVIVHVVVSIFNAGKLENLRDDQVDDEFLAPLRRFLHDQTEAFWNELICFSESRLSIEAYDTVAVYES